MTSPFEFLASSHLFGMNAVFVEEMFARYQQDPNSVDNSWRSFFAQVGEGKAHPRPSWQEFKPAIVGQTPPPPKPNGNATSAPQVVLGKEVIEATSQDSVRALMLINAYRGRGHLEARLDPLQLDQPEPHPELDPVTYGFTPADFNRSIYLGGVLGLQSATINEILAILRRTYCGSVGVEYTHIQYPEQRAWIQERIEGVQGQPNLSAEEKKWLFSVMSEVEGFEQFLSMKYPGTKRFSVQGGEGAIAAVEQILLTSSDVGVEEVVIGMPHRGRMNVLTTTMGRPFIELLSIFHGNLYLPDWVESSGDVKYHLGVSNDRTLRNGKKIHLSLTANPSHLEVVNPVVTGKVRAKQDQKHDADKSRVMGLLLHGDAAFAGQGSVAEVLSLSELRGYRTGGTVHVIVNNQIGFTTSPRYSRFTPYPSDVAKMVQAPIFHVNGDDADAVAFVCRLASEFRQTFKRDVVVDVFCYRKYGHNESDEPAFTQPKMYSVIGGRKAPVEVYAENLKGQGVLKQDDIDARFVELRSFFEKEFEAAKTYRPNKAEWLEGQWSGFQKPKGEHPAGDTGVATETLQAVGKAISVVPEGINVNRKIIRQLEAKQKMLETGEGFDWAMGEALAFGTLALEGHGIRLSGQDSGRGTFSHRHSVLVDQANEERYVPLNHIPGQKAQFEVHDSSLSELAVLGYEYGYSLAEPNSLVLWEAQFGDFANGAQVIIDQFIASGEIKWLRMSGLVMLLPHGYEGQGPEHSSARLERYLESSAEDNWQIANCSTPANYFHILRRQLKRDFRKPLVMMTPKSLLRHKLCVSSLADMAAGTTFQRVIPESQKLTDDKKVKRVVLTSGKVYYDLFEAREQAKITDVALVRVEQYYPFPARELAEQLRKYPNADVIWCQEEPKNMGAWTFMAPRLQALLDDQGRMSERVKYAGRPEAASPATGFAKVHEGQQKRLVEDALKVGAVSAAAA